ncbi:MAG: glycosyltransferase [bacterium]|nr:glycosyltransferase [bacterium]
MEAIFKDVRCRLRDFIHADVKICSRYNDGWISKIYNIVEAAFRQCSTVNHITGEVHFLDFLMRKRTVVLTVLDCNFMKRKKGISRLLVKWIYLDAPISRARAVTAISSKTKEDIVCFTRCDPSKITVIPVAIDECFQPFAKEFNAFEPVVLQIGTAYNKNIPRLAEALNGVKCKLVIVGKLSNEQHQALSRNSVNYENLFNLSKKEIVDQYRRCDIVSFVSTFEGFGMPIVEGNATERVVVTSNTSSMPEVAGEAACLVDPFDVSSIREGIRRVIDDAQYRERLITEGKKNRERFNGERIAKQYLDIYRHLATN